MWIKNWSIIGLLMMSFVANAHAGIEGKYQQKKEIYVATESRGQCEEAGGSWIISDESCLLEATDEVVVEKAKRDYRVSIMTIGSNYHICEYSNIAKIEGSKMITQMRTEEFNPKSGILENVTCKIQVDINKNKLSLKTNEHCQGFCGVNSDMNINDLKKVN
jgi:hypothetical protein